MNLEALNCLEAAFEEANVRFGEATWNTYSGEAEPDLDGAQKRLSSLLTDPHHWDLIDGLLTTVDRTGDPLLTRRLQVWRNCLTGAAVNYLPDVGTLQNRMLRRIADYSFTLGGSAIPRSELQKILRKSPDRALRRSAWLATSDLARTNHDDLLRLIDLRNDNARRLGYRDYVDMAFRLQEIDEPWLHDLLERIVSLVRPIYEACMTEMAEAIDVRQLAPWDVSYAMLQTFQISDGYFPGARALERLHATAEALGFHVDSLPIRTLVRDIPFGGYNVAVRIPTDTRFLVNPSEGHSFYTTTFHEFGHSLAAVFTATTWPILKEYEWAMGAHTAAFAEGMAEIMGDFARQPTWLSKFAVVPKKEIDLYGRRVLPAQMAVRLFELLFNLHLELAAYSQGGESVAALEGQLMREVRLLDLPENCPPVWEANTWYTSYPVYWQNYILASVIAAQSHDALNSYFGSADGRYAGVADYLKENLYACGNSIPWQQRIVRGTGKPLDAESYLRRIAG